MIQRFLLWFSLLLTCSVIEGAEIVVVYPRTADAQTFTYDDQLDSSFIFGRIDPPGGELRINGVSVGGTKSGAFLAYLPLQRDAATKRWDLTLTQQGQVVATLAVPYQFRADLPPAAPDSSLGTDFPRVLRVIDPAAHTRTSPGGSYHTFPAAGTRLLSTGYEGGFFEFDLGGGLKGYVEPKFVETEPDSVLAEARIGDGRYTTKGDSCLCTFVISRPVPWTAVISPDGMALQLLLYGTRLATDRFRFPGGNDYLTDVSWSQESTGTSLSLQFRSPLMRGYDVNFSGDSLTINVRAPYPKRECRLKHKTIVVDAGHGGEAKGAIGPLGTVEKDVNLRWAEVLAKELQRKGANVVLTRSEDVDVPLHERAAMARAHHADFLVSLHANALPDGVNPFLKHGTGTYYYQSHSRRAAEIIHRRLLKASRLRNDGLYDANFAVVRPTSFPAVLLEAAYLMNPPEEELLRSDKYLRKLAKGVASGLAEYFKSQR